MGANPTKVYEGERAGEARYSPPKIKAAIPIPIMGNPKIEFISTSYVERQNLTIRMQMRRFTRLTNAFSKKLYNLKAALALHFTYYNFVRPHSKHGVGPGCGGRAGAVHLEPRELVGAALNGASN